MPGGASGFLSAGFSFRPALEVTGINTTNTPPTAGTMIQVMGHNFGIVDNTVTIAIGSTTCSSSEWISQTMLKCTASPGFGAAQDITLYTAVSAVSVLPAALSYDDPDISMASPANGPVAAVAGQIVTLYGTNMGTWQQNVSLEVEGMSATVEWISDTAVVAAMVTGEYGSHANVKLDIAGRVGFLGSHTYSYDLPKVLTSTLSSGASIGAYSLNVTGSDFGLIQPVPFYMRVGETRCTPSTWISDTSAMGVVTGGTGVGHVVGVDRAAALGVEGPAFAFFAPSVSAIIPDHLPVGAGGAIALTIYGTGFGPSAPPVPANAIIGSSACTSVSYISDSSMQCLVASGTGKGHQVSVNVSTQDSANGTQVMFSYDAPMVTALAFTVAPSTGHPGLAVYGINFGNLPPSPSNLTTRVGDTGCTTMVWTSDTALSCSVVGGAAGSVATVYVSLSEQTSTSNDNASLSFVLPPLVTAVKRIKNANTSFTEDGGRIEIYGSNFGTGPAVAATVGFSDCDPTLWLSESSLKCSVVAGMGSLLPVSVYVNAGASTLSKAFNYTTPLINASSPAVMSGDVLVTIVGANFGLHDLSPMLRMGGTSCTASLWISASSITCKAPHGVGGKKALVVTISQAVSTLLEGVSYTPPTVTGITDLSSAYATSGSATLIITGQDMGTIDHGMSKVVVGVSECRPTQWQSASSLLCTIPAGIGYNYDVSLLVSGFDSPFCVGDCGSSSEHFSYRAPTITSIVPSVGASGGGDIITIYGNDFGDVSYNNTVGAAFVGETPCALTMWVGSSIVTCKTPRGALHQRSVSIEVAGQTNLLEKAFSFGSPSCGAIADAEPSATDGYYLLDQDGAHDMNETFLNKVWCNIENERAGVTGRLGLYSGSLALWLEASTGSDLETSGPDRQVHGTPAYVDRWHARRPVAASGLPELYGTAEMRPIYGKEGVVTFDGVDDVLVTTVKRETRNATVFVAFRPNFDTRPDGKCPSGAKPSHPVIGGRACAPGWILSDNDLSDPRHPKGLGIHVGRDGLVQAVIGSQTGLYSAQPLTALASGCMHIVAVETSAVHMKMWVDGSSTPDVSFQSSLDARSGTVNMTIAARGTHYISGMGGGVVDQDHFAGQISEVVVVETVLDDTQRARVQRALVSRWQCNAAPPADGGHITIRSEDVVQESVTLRVELERMGGSDGYVSLSFLFENGTAMYGVDGGFRVLNGTDGNGMISWDHGELGTRLLLVEPIQDHLWNDNTKNFTMKLDIVYAEFMVHLSTREKNIGIENNDPHISAVFPRNGPALGGAVVTVTGLAFKRNDTRISATMPDASIYLQPAPLMYDMRLGDTSCRQLHWLSETSLTCVTAAGTGGALTVRVNVEGNYTEESVAFDYNAPANIQFNPPSAPTTGAVVLTVTGSNFGTSDYNASVDVGATRCESLWTSDTSLSCTLAPGVGVHLDLNVTLYKDTEHESSGKSAQTWCYQRPVISSVSLDRQTGALPRVALLGHGFGPHDYTPVVMIGNLACTETVWVSERSLSCLVPPGSGINQAVTVNVGGAVSEIVPGLTFAYLAAPIVSAWSNLVWGRQAAQGRANITVTGARFGLSNSNPKVLIGDTFALSTSWIAESSVSAQVAAGVGKDLPLAVQVYAQTGVSNTSVFNYHAPVITQVHPITGPTAGNFSLTVLGSFFGEMDYNQTVLFDQIECLHSSWISSTAMECIAPAGYGNVDIVVNAGGNSGSGIDIFQFAGASGSSIWQTQPRRTVGGDVLRVYGQEFGPNTSYSPGAFDVVVGQTSCQSTTWVSESAIDCELAAGTGTGLNVKIIISDYISQMNGIFSYDEPEIASLAPSHLPTSANASISIHGTNFGTACAANPGDQPLLCSISVTIGATACDNVEWVSDSTLVCRRSAQGVGLDLAVVVEVDGVQASSSNTSSNTSRFSYDAPIVTKIEPGSMPDHGGLNLTVSGQNFGFEPPSTPGISVLVGSSACEPVIWRSDTQVICRVSAGTGSNQGVAASVKGNFRPAGLWAVTYFSAPLLSSFAPSKVAPLGGQTLTIHGSHFTPLAQEAAPSITVAGEACAVLDSPRTPNLLACVMPRLGTGPWPVEITVGNRKGRKVLAEAPPRVTSVTAVTPAMAGGAPITIYGSSFGGTEPAVLDATVTRDKCSPLEWISDSSIECTLPKGLTSSMPSVVVRRSGLEGAPFYFTATDPDDPKPRTAIGLMSKGSSVQLVSVDVVNGAVAVLSAFRLGVVDYGMTSFDSALKMFHVVTSDGQGNFILTSLSIDQQVITSSLEVQGAGGSGRRRLLAHENSVLINIEYDQPRQNIVGILAHKGASFLSADCDANCDDLCVASCTALLLSSEEYMRCIQQCRPYTPGCSQTELMIVNVVDGTTTVRPIANASMALNVRALDSASSSFFAIVEGAHQRLVVLNTDATRPPSSCENAGGMCQAMQGGTDECVHVASQDSESEVSRADSICAALGTACDFADWEASLSMYVMRTRIGASITCNEAQVLYGPKMHGVRAMTFDAKRARLVLVIEDVLGVHRSSPGDNFLIIEMDVRSIAPLPQESIYQRVYNRRLLSEYTFWERDGFWASQGMTQDAAGLQLAMPQTKKLLGFSSRRVLPGVMVLLYQRGLVLLQEEADSMRALKYIVDQTPVSDATEQSEMAALVNAQFRDLRALVPVEDLLALAQPRVVFISPTLVSAQGTTEVTIIGQNFGVVDSSPVIRVNGLDCGSSIWVSSVELLCSNVPALPSGTFLDLVGGRVQFNGLGATAYFPEALKYVSQATWTDACCRTCHCPHEIWTWESSGQSGYHRIANLLSQIVTDNSLLLCGPAPRNCTLTFVQGNSELLVHNTLALDNAGSLEFDLAPFQNGNASYDLHVTDGYVETRKRISIVSLSVNNAPVVVFNSSLLSVCEASVDTTYRSYSVAQVSQGGLGHVTDEAEQEVSVFVTPVAGNFGDLFRVGDMPKIYPASGMMTFVLQPGAYGSATFNVSVRDNGGRGSDIPGTPQSCGSSGMAADGTLASCNWDQGENTTLTIQISRQNTPPHFVYNSSIAVHSTVMADDDAARSVVVDGQGLLKIWEGAGQLTLDGFAGGIIAGSRAEEHYQSVAFSVVRVSQNINVLAVDPVIQPDGTLLVTPGVNIGVKGGREEFIVTLTDDGVTKCGGSNFFARNFTVEVNYVNHAPSLTVRSDVTSSGSGVSVLENACSSAPCSVAQFVSQFSAGPNEAWQNTSFVVHVVDLFAQSDCGGLHLFNRSAFSSSGKTNPHMDESGALVFSVLPWCSGTALVEIQVLDSGGTERGGQNRSAVQAFNITIASVDQPPSFTLALSDVSVDSGDFSLKSYGSFASDMSPGAPAGLDTAQAMSFIVVQRHQTALPAINGGELFAVLPSVDISTGTLTFAVFDGQFGLATFNLTLQDTGLLSYTQQITITCESINDPPILTQAHSSFNATENSGDNGPMLLFSSVSPGFADEQQNISFYVNRMQGDYGLFASGGSPSVTCTTTQTSVCATALLHFTLLRYRFGQASFDVVAVDSGPTGSGHNNTAAAESFSLTVSPVNSPPSFSLLAPTLVVDQDSWCVEGPSFEGPGNCSYTSQVYSEKVHLVSEKVAQKMHLRRNFASSLRMGGVLDPYEIRAADSYVLNELNLVLNVSASVCPDEPCDPQLGTFAVVADNQAAANQLFVVMPFVAPDGSLVFSLRENRNGVASFTVTLTDDGGASTGGLTSEAHAFTIQVLPINAAPTYQLVPPNIIVQPYAMAQEVRNFVQNISVGPVEEEHQSFIVMIHVLPSDRALFTAQGLPRYRTYDNSLFFIPAATIPVDSVSIELQIEIQDTGGNARSTVPAWFPNPVGSDNSTVTPFNITFVGASPSVTSGQTWSKLSSAHLPLTVDGVSMTPRLGHAVVEFMGDIWVLGGYMTPKENASEPWRGSRRLLNDHNPEYLLSDVWRLHQVATGICTSRGLCLKQTRVQTHAAWAGRHSHAAVVMGSRIWIMGGVTAQALPSHDVWSSYDGVHWKLVTATAPWSPRFSMAIDTIAKPAGSEDPGVMIVAGGGSYTGDGAVMYNDVWTSADGLSWQLLSADAGWTPRAGHAMTSLRGHEGNITLWLAGGEELSGATQRDVWYSSDNGASWHLSTAVAPWMDRAGHAMLRYRGHLLLMSGRSSIPVNIDLDEPILRDVWTSHNGHSWQLVLDQAPFEGRELFGAAVHPDTDRLVLIGGQGLHGRMDDVWVSPHN